MSEITRAEFDELRQKVEEIHQRAIPARFMEGKDMTLTQIFNWAWKKSTITWRPLPPICKGHPR